MDRKRFLRSVSPQLCVYSDSSTTSSSRAPSTGMQTHLSTEVYDKVSGGQVCPQEGPQVALKRPDSSCGGSQGSDRSVGGRSKSGLKQVVHSVANAPLPIGPEHSYFTSSIDNLTDDSHSNSSKGIEETVRSFVDCNEVRLFPKFVFLMVFIYCSGDFSL